MLTLVNILIIFFIFLIVYQIFLATNVIVEGLENNYQEYDMNNPANAMILAQQNAGNISYLKERLDDYQGLYQMVQDLSGNYSTLQQQVDQLMVTQQDYANQITGGSPPEITGAVDNNNSTSTDASNYMVE